MGFERQHSLQECPTLDISIPSVGRNKWVSALIFRGSRKDQNKEERLMSRENRAYFQREMGLKHSPNTANSCAMVSARLL